MTLVSAAGIAADSPHALAQGIVGESIVADHIVAARAEGLAILVNVPQRMLFSWCKGGVMACPIAVGRPTWPTPLGEFTILSKEVDPTWDVPPSIQEEMRRSGTPVVTRVPPGPANPLGRYWIGLSLHNIGIHGTSAPSSISKAATHGCLRLHATDIEALFSRVAVGGRGRIVYEPVLMARIADRIYLEAHTDIYHRASGPAIDTVRAEAAARGWIDDIDWPLVDRVIRLRAGVATYIGHQAAVQPNR